MTIAEYPSSHSPDGMLVRAYLAGDATAFNELFEAYSPKLIRLLRRQVRDEALAEDLAQDAYERALRYLDGYDPAMPFWPWLRKIAINLVPGELHRRAVELPVDEVDRTSLTLADTTDGVVSRDAVIECLMTLPPRHRRVLVWRYVEDRDTADIAAFLGLTRNAVEQLMLRARKGFRKEYRARNAAPLFPGFAGLAAKVRRLLATLGSKLGVASGATVSIAGDWALGAALTVGGLGIVTGMHPSLPGDVRAGRGPGAVVADAPFQVADSRDSVPASIAAHYAAGPGSGPASVSAEGAVTAAVLAAPGDAATAPTAPGADQPPAGAPGPGGQPPSDKVDSGVHVAGTNPAETEMHQEVAVTDDTSASGNVETNPEAFDDGGGLADVNVGVTVPVVEEPVNVVVHQESSEHDLCVPEVTCLI